jgi:PAS domain S-box-containing protein
MRSALSFSSLRFRLILLVFLAVLPPLGLIVYTVAEWRREETMDAKAHALQLARHASAIHLRLVDESHDMLFSLSRLPVVMRGEKAALQEVLVAFLREHPRHKDVGLIDRNGKIVLSAQPLGDTIDVAQRAFFRRAIETRRFASGDPEIDPIGGKGRLTFAYPVLGKDGRVERVLFTVMDLLWVGELAAEALLPAGTTVTVFDGAGTILAYEPNRGTWLGRLAPQDPMVDAARSYGKEGTFEGTSLDRIPRLFAFKPLEGHSGAKRLYVSVGVPAAVTIAASERVLFRNLIGLGLAALLAMAVGWIGGYVFLLRGMTTLMRTTNRISGGDLSARTGLAQGHGELNELARAVDEMAAVLQEREQEIRRQHEEQANQQRRFRALIENSSDGIALIDSDRNIRYLSPSSTRILGYPVEQRMGRDALEFFHPDDRAHVAAALADVAQRPGSFFSASFRVQHENGSWRWIGMVATNLLADPSVQAIVANYRDITERREAEESLRKTHEELELRVHQRTAELLEANEALQAEIAERKRAEEALLESEDRILLLLNSAAEGIYGVDLHGNCIFCNPACARLLGFSEPRHLLGSRMHRVMHHTRPDGTPYPEEECRAYDSFRLGAGTHVDSEVFWRTDGTSFPVEYWSYPMRRGGELVGSVVTFLDITERQRTEEALRKLSRAIEQTGDSVFVTNRDGIIEYVNPSFEKLTRYSRQEAIGATPRIHNSGRHDQRFYERLWNTILSGQVFRAVFTNQKKDGQLYYEEQTITPIRDGQGRITHFVSTGRDITRRRRTEEALRRLNDQFEHEASRIANVLHDEAGQFLTSAHITLAQVARDLEAQSRERLQAVRRDLDQIEEQLRRLSHELHPRILDDMGLVDALKFLADGVSRRAGIPICVEASLENRFSPLLETALYRLVQEGLTNMTKHARATQATIVLKQEGQVIQCSIRDDGVGFDVEAVLVRRDVMGLGLLGIQDRLEAVGGTLRIISSLGNGTELRATIPLEDDTLAGSPGAGSPSL